MTGTLQQDLVHLGQPPQDNDKAVSGRGTDPLGYHTHAEVAGYAKGKIEAAGLAMSTGDIKVTAAGGISAAGSSQSDATALIKAINLIGTVGSGQGVKLQAAAAGTQQTVINGGANDLKVYPPTGGAIDGGATNAAVTLLPGQSAKFECPATDIYRSSGFGLGGGLVNGPIRVGNTGSVSAANIQLGAVNWGLYRDGTNVGITANGRMLIGGNDNGQVKTRATQLDTDQGALMLTASGLPMFDLLVSGIATNFIRATGKASGNAPTLTAQGQLDANVNFGLQAKGSGVIDFLSVPRDPTYTVGTVPAPATVGAGAHAYISNESGGAIIAFCDGTNWRRPQDRNVIS